MYRNLKLLVCVFIFILFNGVTFAQDPSSDDWANSGTDSVKTERNVGIGLGTNSPITKLHVKTATDANIGLYAYAGIPTIVGFTDGGASTVFRLAGSPLLFTGSGGSGDEHMRIMGNGDIGIGTYAPSSKLHIDTQTSNQDLTVLKISHRAATQKVGARIELGSQYTASATSRIIGYSNPSATNASQLEFQTMDPNGQTWHSLYMNENGNVGIGTTTPGSMFHIYSPSYQNRLLGISDINLDTADPWQGAVQIKVANTGNNWLLNTVSYSADGKGVRFYNNGGSVDRTAFEIVQAAGSRFIVDGTGNVGIGTTTPTGGKLVVNGTIRAKEVKVENNIAANEFIVNSSRWSDFVFEDNYNLPTLDKVESFIKENKHLPDIPSAKQVEEEGLSMSQMMAKQMQKIEELTLYVIEQNKKLESQNDEIATLKAKVTELEMNE